MHNNYNDGRLMSLRKLSSQNMNPIKCIKMSKVIHIFMIIIFLQLNFSVDVKFI